MKTISNMKYENGKLIHENYKDSFNYKGRLFIIDKGDGFYQATESQMLISSRNENREKVIEQVKIKWNSVEDEYKNFQ